MMMMMVLMAEFIKSNNELLRRLRLRRRRRQVSNIVRIKQGRGVPVRGEEAPYVQRNGFDYYRHIRYECGTCAFEDTCGVTEDEFDEVCEGCSSNLEAPLLSLWDDRDEESRKPRKKSLSSEQMLFLFFWYVRAGNEGGLGHRHVANLMYVSPGSITNYLRHTLIAAYTWMKQEREFRIE